MQAIGFAILLGMIGTFVGALYTFVIGFAGTPGAMLTEIAMRRAKTNLIPTWGLVLTLVGQLYMALAFVAFVVLTTKNHLFGMSGPVTWIAWVVAFYVSTVPGWAALKDSAQAERKNVQRGASAFTAPLSAIGFFLFVFFPSAAARGWPWVPFQQQVAAALDHSPRGESARKALMTPLALQDVLRAPLRNHDDTLRARRQITASLSALADVRRASLDSVYAGWGDAIFEELVPAMRNVTQLFNPDSTFTSGPSALPATAAEMMRHFNAYDQWMTTNRAQFMEALLQQRIIEAYSDSAAREHRLK